MKFLKSIFRKTEETSDEVASKASWIWNADEEIEDIIATLVKRGFIPYAIFLKEYRNNAKSVAGSCLTQKRGK